MHEAKTVNTHLDHKNTFQFNLKNIGGRWRLLLMLGVGIIYHIVCSSLDLAYVVTIVSILMENSN
jgi:hypothetical protein